jgi:hypothetical protein
MIALTKKGKHKIYKQALSQLEGGYGDGVCCLLFRLSRPITGDRNYPEFEGNNRMDLFPEFKALEPKGAATYWWNFDHGGTAERIKAIKKCIELTK